MGLIGGWRLASFGALFEAAGEWRRLLGDCVIVSSHYEPSRLREGRDGRGGRRGDKELGGEGRTAAGRGNRAEQRIHTLPGWFGWCWSGS